MIRTLAVLFAVGLGFVPQDGDEIRKLIERLGAEEPAERDKASARLLELGEKAVAALREAQKSADPEIVARAGEILDVLDVSKRFGKYTKDKALQKKYAALLKENPGKAIVLVRVVTWSDGRWKPLGPGGLRFGLGLIDATSKQGIPITSAGVDEEGEILFLIPPTKVRVIAYNCSSPSLEYTSWDPPKGVSDATEVLVLPDVRLAPEMHWKAPATRSKVSIKENPEISWEPFPGLAKVRLELQLEGPAAPPPIVECAGGTSVRLSDILKASPKPLGVGTRFQLMLYGVDAGGLQMSGGRSALDLVLTE